LWQTPTLTTITDTTMARRSANGAITPIIPTLALPTAITVHSGSRAASLLAQGPGMDTDGVT
jgi:hypothetical protein